MCEAPEVARGGGLARSVERLVRDGTKRDDAAEPEDGPASAPRHDRQDRADGRVEAPEVHLERAPGRRGGHLERLAHRRDPCGVHEDVGWTAPRHRRGERIVERLLVGHVAREGPVHRLVGRRAAREPGHDVAVALQAPRDREPEPRGRSDDDRVRTAHAVSST